MSKYYAIAVGKVPGIYRDWASAKLQVDGYSGAVFKSFYSESEATTYMLRNSVNKIIPVSTAITPPTNVTPIASPSGSPLKLTLNISDIKTPPTAFSLSLSANKVTDVVTTASTVTKVQHSLTPTVSHGVSSDILPLLNATTLYTDGSGEGGGFGYGGVIIPPSGEVKTYNGPLPYTLDDCSERLSGTNNQCELYAIYKGLSMIKGNVKVFSDSKYAIGCLKDWWPKWEKHQWKDVMNKSLIKACLLLMKDRSVTFDHVYSHTGNIYNEMADKQAKLGAKSYIRK